MFGRRWKWNAKHMCLVIVPTFLENGIFMLGVIFYSVNFHKSKKLFSTKFFIPIEDIDFLSSNVKRHFPCDDFL